MKSMKSRTLPRATERARRRLLELRKSIASEYWRERKASQTPFEGQVNIFGLAAHCRESDIVISLSELGREQVFLIDEALHRIDEGSYGACMGCGGAIPRARLEVVPWAPLCVRCQQAQEDEPRRAA